MRSGLFRSTLPSALLVILVLLLTTVTTVLASSGDREEAYQYCLQSCEKSHCHPSTPPLPLTLRLTFWSCQADCKYHCTHAFTSNRAPGERVHQFYGKWPFWRVFGMQEPASVLFSIGNGLMHWEGYKKVRRRARASSGLKVWMMGLSLVQMNTWFWSAMFHTRDTPFTEKMDYFAASITILYTCHYTILRQFHLYATPPSRPSPSRFQKPVSIAFIILYLCHITYLLSTPRFNYGYNIAFNLSVGVVHLTLWTIYSAKFTTRLPFPFTLVPEPYPPLDSLAITPKPTFRTYSAALVLGTTAAMSLELFDFPPFFRVIDAHSLWHAATIIIARSWYDFLLKDAAMVEAARLGEFGVARVPVGGGSDQEVEKVKLRMRK